MSTASAPTAFDPYEPRPTFVQRHADALAASVVFVLTIVLTVGSFPPFHAPEFAYAMLVPGIYWAYTRPRLKLFAGTLFAAQAVAWTILLGWLHHVTWVGLFLLGPFIGAWVGTWFLAAWWALPRILGRPTLTRLIVVLGLAGLWVLIEWTRTWLFGGFPWLPLSASQWERTSILQIAAFTGAYGVSFVLVMMNLGFGAYAHRLFRESATGINKRSQEFFLALFLLLACVCVHFQESFNRRGYTIPFARIAFVQPYIPQEVKWDPARAPAILDILQRTTLEAAATRPDLIIWPEAVTPMAVRGEAVAQSFVETLVKKANVPLLLGSIAIENGGTPKEAWFNGSFLVTPEGGVAARYYAKRHLVPFGEYVPLRSLLGWLSKVVPIGGDFLPGEDSSPLLVPIKGQPVVWAPLICYEDIYPQLARFSALGGANVLAVLTNNGWFGEGGAAYQHAAHSVLRAVETRRPVIRCGNGGWSGWIDEFGNIRKVVTNDAGTIYFRGTRTLDVSRDARWVDQTSVYTEYGDWFLLVAAGCAMFGVALLKMNEATGPVVRPTA
ncbi:apolipoprotein N-acyltransferase [Horticoccus sp. 23ND18S-11]|uniref:apolipoprotein N-acyltransferase n=1 Tax=Horticoccus sp. 23ND18S-11 TaxID=3391832 RepID=UPI0039C90241